MDTGSLPAPAPAAAVVDYPARDMTITVGAGMPFGELSRLLQAEGQQLPIDVAADSVTLGTVVAEDLSGPRQYGYGTMRDYVIGIEAVDGQGRVFHAGGRVVKNVAGYDLCRLLVGSRGRLGTITQLTFKLKPLPAMQSMMVLAMSTFEQLKAALERLNVSSATPVILDLVTPASGRKLFQECSGIDGESPEFRQAAVWLVVGVEGPEAACAWQESVLREELREISSAVSGGHAGISDVYCRLAQQWSAGCDSVPWKARVTVLPSQTADVAAAVFSAGCEVIGRAGNGILVIEPALSGETASSPPSEDQIDDLLRSLVPKEAGFVRFLRSESNRERPSSVAVDRYSRQLVELLGVK